MHVDGRFGSLFVGSLGVVFGWFRRVWTRQVQYSPIVDGRFEEERRQLWSNYPIGCTLMVAACYLRARFRTEI